MKHKEKNKHPKICAACDIKFLVTTSVKNKGGGLFCGRLCANEEIKENGWWQSAYNTGVGENIHNKYQANDNKKARRNIRKKVIFINQKFI